MRGIYALTWLAILVLGAVFIGCRSQVSQEQATRQTPSVRENIAPVKLEWEGRWDKYLLEARKEGMVMVYTSQGPEMRESLRKNFTDKYGIKLDFVAGSTSETVNKIRTERRYGLYLVDVLIVGYTTLINELKPYGDIIEPVEPVLFLPEVVDPRVWRGEQMPFIDKDKMVIGMSAQFMRYITRNTDQIKEGEINSFNDLLKPQYKGKIIMRDPTTSGTGNAWVSFMVKLWGLEQAKDYLKQYVQQEPVITRDTRLQMESVARGKYPVGVATSGDATAEFVKLGAPVAVVRTQHGGVILPGGGSLGLPSKRPHPNAASIFVNWLLSKEGQTAFVMGYGQPSSRTDVPRGDIHTSLFPEPGEKVYLTSEEDAINQGKLTGLAREIFFPASR